MERERRQQARILDTVRRRYTAVARRARRSSQQAKGGCCDANTRRSPAACCGGYERTDLSGLPPEAVAASAGCGNPVALADLHPGEVVLDLGSGGGIDVLLSARRVGPGGFAWGIDMTGDMLAVAEENRRRSGLAHVAFLDGQIERLPLPDAAVDVIISNCVINLSVDKAATLREAARVLRPGGRLAVYDMVAARPLPPFVRRVAGAWAACVAGTLDDATFARLLHEAGFVEVEIRPASTALAGEPGCCDGAHAVLPVRSAFIRARKPAAAPPAAAGPGNVVIEPASPADLPAILALVDHSGLPTAGVAEHLDGFMVARRLMPGTGPVAQVRTLVGCAGIEWYGHQALLRSVAVTPPLRSAGLGARLVEAALAAARSAGASEVYLLTTTAEVYFRRFGFDRVERNAVQGPVTASQEFTSLCPTTAAVMRRVC